ncbi:MAG: hypothetical protein P1U57_01810 [Oleibacter sp.]|nr:hypothetical protein [Thalassolituus sp.]
MLLFLGVCIPATITFNLGSLVLTPLRIVSFYLFLVSAPYVLNTWSKNRVLKYLDILVLIHVLWAYIAMMKNHGLGEGIEGGGFYTVDFLPFYMLGRLIGLNSNYVKVFAKAVLIVAGFLLPFALIECIWGINLIKELLGQPTDFFEQRMGLNRTYSSFSHPILFGMFSSSLLGMLWFSLPGNKKVLSIIILLLCTLTALSSAPILMFFFQLSLVVWGALMKNNPRKWKLVLWGSVSAILFIEILSPAGFIRWVIVNMTFNSQTGYYRLLIWEFGSAEAWRHPIFGIGYHDWVRPGYMNNDTVDNFWLLQSMRYGLPSTISLISVLLASVIAVSKSQLEEWKSIKQGWIISIVGFVIVGMTVHLWSSAFSIFALMIGIGVSIGFRRPNSNIRTN